MADQDNIGQELKTLLETQARTFEGRLSRNEACRENTGRLQRGPTVETSRHTLKVQGLVSRRGFFSGR